MKFRRFVALIAIVSMACASTASAQSKSKDKDKKPSAKKSDVKPYDEVIPEDAETKAGLFMTHQVGEDLFYEIPTSQLDKDMLWVVQVERTQAGFSYAGMPVGDRVVRWELRDETVLLRDVKYEIRAETDDPIAKAVKATSVRSIIKAFPVKAWGKDKAPVIDVSSLFKSEVSEISAKQLLGANNMDSSRSFIEEIKAFPNNLETKVLATYPLSASNSSTGRFGGDSNRDRTQSSVTALVHHSMLVLPDEPMKPRVHDERVGFFTVGFDDFANNPDHQVESVRLITRWRLEKKDPEAEVSEVVKPIVFYVGRGVPEKWKPFVKKGIEAWQPAFEAAGFKNAIQGKYAPSVKEDPNWDAEDARISTIRWLPSSVENAFGPHVHDPRTGEILEADVRMFHNVLKLARDWYFVQASPNDKRAQKLPLPDDLVGELLAYIVAHEVGHSLGFPHNMQASSTYTVANLRDPEFTKKYGVEASIMDYGRFNYVAQPGDGAALIPVVGPYDFFAVKWGYGQYESDEAETAGLAKLFDEQVKNPMLRFGSADPSEDPRRQTEDLSGETIEATRLGMKNIDRVAEYLVEACCKEDDDYGMLENMYNQLLSQRSRELMHVTAVVGGFEKKNLFYGDADQVYHPIPAEKQKAAVQLLIEHGLHTPEKLVAPEITLRLEADGAPSRILSAQSRILRSLLSETRINRMTEHAQRSKDAYTPVELMSDLRAGVWKELEQNEIAVDIYRRNLQRAHADLLIGALAGSSSSDLPALARAELKTLAQMIERVRTDDLLTRAHFDQLAEKIEQALDPE